MRSMNGASAVLLLLTAGCGGWRVYEPGRRVDMGLYTIDPQISWSAWSWGKGQDWTVDGWAVHELRFMNGVKDGRALWPAMEEKENPPLFKKDMTPHEIAELVAATMSKTGAQKVRTTGLKPQAFGRLTGFRFELEYADRRDLEMQALATGVVHEERLYLILYWGAMEHYFPKYRDPVEKMIASIQLPEDAR